ncbi:hypothetical protein F5146DRAFT_1219867 [Armillaria mellea]|nr:hypothetical protein F5146DRAFT_1219867 [Armillaria mellea]
MLWTEICVSQEGETYASALELNAERCTIFIVGNQEQVPQRTQEYLTDLCRRLTNVANVADATGPSGKGFPPMVRDSIDQIYRSVLSFTFPKLLARLTKWNGPWRDRIVDIDEIELAEADRKKFEDLTQALNSLYRVATGFKDPIDVEDTKILDTTVGSLSEEWYLNNPDTAAFVHMLDVLPADDENNTPFSIEWYLQKILKTYDQTTKLVDFALSSRHGDIFQNQLEFVFLHSHARHVELNVQGAINKVEHQMITTREDKVYLNRLKGQKLEERYICCPHCECAMLENLLRRWKSQSPEPIIGISALSCFGCRLYFMAYSYARLRLTVSCPCQFILGIH